MGGVTAGAMGLGIVITLKDQISKGLDYIQKKVVGLKGASNDMLESFTIGAKQMAIGLGMMGAGAMVLSKTFSAPLAAAQTFQTGLAEVGTLVEGNVIQMKMLGDNAMALSNKYGKSTQEMLSATYQAISAGVAVKDSAKFLDAAGMMAIGGVTDIKTATDGLTSAMKAYGRGIEDISDISDSFFTAMKYGKTTVGELSGVIGQVASGAATAGIKFDELMAAIAAATLTGQSTSEAATGMRAAIKAMVAPTTQASKLAKELGLQYNEAALKTKGLNGMFKEMMEKTGGSQEKLTELLGSSEAMAAMMNAMAQGGQNFNMILDEMAKKSGATQKAFETVSQTFEFQKARMLAGLETLKVKFGTVILPVVTAISAGVTKLVEILNGLPKPVFTMLAALAGLVGVALILGGAVMAIAGAIQLWRVSWLFLKAQAAATMTSIKAGLVGVKAATTAAMLPMLKWAAIAGIVYWAWKNNLFGIQDTTKAISEGFKMALKASKDGIVEVDAKTVEELKKAGIWEYSVKMGKVFWRMRRFVEGFADGARSALKTLQKAWNDLMEAMKPAETQCKAFLKSLGLLDDTAKSDSQKWNDWGVTIGKWGTYLLVAAAAVKALSVGVAICNAVMAASPITWLIYGIVGVCAALYVFYTRWDELKTGARAWWEMIQGLFSGIGEWFSEKFNAVIEAIVSPFRTAFDKVKQLWADLKSWLTGTPATVPEPIVSGGTRAPGTASPPSKVPTGRKTPAAAALAGHQRTNNQQAGAAVAAAQAQNPPVVKNNVDVSIAPQPVTFSVDGKQLGKTVAKYNANERKREGKE